MLQLRLAGSHVHDVPFRGLTELCIGYVRT